MGKVAVTEGSPLLSTSPNRTPVFAGVVFWELVSDVTQSG